MKRRLVVAPIAIALCVAAAGCGPEFKEFTSKAPPEARADLVQVAHDITFGGDELYMTVAAGRRLDEFLANIGVDRQDRVVVVDRDTGSPWAAQRAESVRLHLTRHQIPSEPGHVAPGAASRPDTVSVVVERYVVAALDCPDWTQPRGSNPENATHRNFGCADAHNLGQMVADKRDLAVGRGLAPTDGMLMARGVNEYRRDIQKPLEVSIVSGFAAQRQQQQQGGGAAGAAGGSQGVGQ